MFRAYFIFMEIIASGHHLLLRIQLKYYSFLYKWYMLKFSHIKKTVDRQLQLRYDRQ